MLPSTAPNPDLHVVVVVALRTRPTSLAVLGFPPATVPTLAPIPEPMLPWPRTPRRSCSQPACRPRTSGLRFLTEEAGVPTEDLSQVLRWCPRQLVSPVVARLQLTLYFLWALGVPDLPRHADLLSFSVEDKLLQQIEFLDSHGLLFSFFGSFFGPSKPVISERVIEERKSMKELQNTMYKDRRPSGKDIPSSSKVQAKTNGFHLKQKIVNEAKRKAEALKDNRDYSFLLSDDADISSSPKEKPMARSSLTKKSASYQRFSYWSREPG